MYSVVNTDSMKHGMYHLILVGTRGLVGMKSAHAKTNEVKLWRQIFNNSKAIKPESGMRFGLTPQEVKVAKLVGDGLMNKEVADKLGVALSTVCTQVSRIYKKVGAKNRAQMVLKLGSITL